MNTVGLTEHGLELRFADGLGGTIPLADIPEVSGPEALTGLELPNPYEVVLTTANGERVEIPWDFARHYCDATYRPIIETLAMQGRRTLGGRIRQLRESAGLTQVALADLANKSKTAASGHTPAGTRTRATSSGGWCSIH